MTSKQDRFRGCLIGGAIGDALGWPVEFMSRQQISERFGPDGIRKLVLTFDGNAQITDDTQMTLFTAEGLLRAEACMREKGICHLPKAMHSAYLRWLFTQVHRKLDLPVYDGWLLSVKELHVPRAPGNSCLSALQSGRMGTIGQPINNSKGCGE